MRFVALITFSLFLPSVALAQICPLTSDIMSYLSNIEKKVESDIKEKFKTNSLVLFSLPNLRLDESPIKDEKGSYCNYLDENDKSVLVFFMGTEQPVGETTVPHNINNAK